MGEGNSETQEPQESTQQLTADLFVNAVEILKARGQSIKKSGLAGLLRGTNGLKVSQAVKLKPDEPSAEVVVFTKDDVLEKTSEMYFGVRGLGWLRIRQVKEGFEAKGKSTECSEGNMKAQGGNYSFVNYDKVNKFTQYFTRFKQELGPIGKTSADGIQPARRTATPVGV